MIEFYKKHEQIIKYLFFGVLTTVVGWAVYFGVLFGMKAAMSIPVEDTSSAKYLVAYTTAQVVQWVAAVLFAFFVDRKWVFTKADKDSSVVCQLGVFAGGRVLTFLLDYGVTYFGAIALAALFPWASRIALLGRDFNANEIAAKLVSAVIVIIGNYFFSKLLVFKEKRERNEEK